MSGATPAGVPMSPLEEHVAEAEVTLSAAKAALGRNDYDRSECAALVSVAHSLCGLVQLGARGVVPVESIASELRRAGTAGQATLDRVRQSARAAAYTRLSIRLELHNKPELAREIAATFNELAAAAGDAQRFGA